MHLSQLQITDFRNIHSAELESSASMNWLCGENGAGKTSVLEAIYLLSRGRSFRNRSISPLIREGANSLTVFGRTADPASSLGVSRQRGGWQGRINGQTCQRVSAFAQTLPVVLIEPANHQLVQGGPEYRRAFMDWGMFHVEPVYLQTWRRFNRLLHQRNAALKSLAPDRLLDALEQPMAEAAEEVDLARAQYVESLKRETEMLHDALGLRFSRIELHYPPQQQEQPYLINWQQNRERDRAQGFTRAGPHRADLKLMVDRRLAAPRLSRGQQKLTALMLLLAQLQVSVRAGRQPLLLLDDPISELDAEHLDNLLAWVQSYAVQVWVAAVEAPAKIEGDVFHVEHGVVRRLG